MPRPTAYLAISTCLAFAPFAGSVESSAQSDSPGFAVVELFTSEGCSSCPPADRLLAELDSWAQQNETPVYALSFHVDYWDRLGWADPYGSTRYSQRQRAYAAAAEESSVYTPQMIVNGTRRFVGSDGKAAVAALTEALAAQPSTSLKLQASAPHDGQIRIRYQTTKPADGSVLNVALVQPTGVQDIARGENAGRRLTHVNVVRSLKTTKVDATGTGTVSVGVPADADGPLKTIAFIQAKGTGRVLAAASASAP